MELKILRIGEGGLPWREVEREGARGEGEAPAGAPLLGASASGAAAAAPPGPAGGADLQQSLGPCESCQTRMCALSPAQSYT